MREIGVDVRIGLHADESSPRSGDLDWVFVATGNRISSLAGPGESSSPVRWLRCCPNLRFGSSPEGGTYSKGFPMSTKSSRPPGMKPCARTRHRSPRSHPRCRILGIDPALGLDPDVHRHHRGNTDGIEARPEEWRKIREDHDALIEREVSRADGKIVDSAEIKFFVTFQLPAEALSCAFAFRDGVRSMGLTVSIELPRRRGGGHGR